MKVGDMVELSAAGQNTEYCWDVRGKTGIVVGVHSRGAYPIVVSWMGGKTWSLLRRSLKFVSKA